MNAREVALDLLNQWPRTHRLADEILDVRLAKTALSGSDRALVTELFYGCLRQKLALEFILGKAAAKPPHPVVANILKLGFYQLLFLKTPPHAAVHETVALAKRRASASEAGFVNAVLRHANMNTLATAPAWVRHSHPEWLWNRWAARWGTETTGQLCEWNNTPPPVYIRVNRLAGRASSRPSASQSAASREFAPPDGVRTEQSAFHPSCFRALEPAGLFDTPAWKQGEFYVQDPSTLVAVDVLDPQAGESVLDMCAAPGGKTTYIAQLMRNQGEIVAADASNPRLQRVIENCQRLGVTIVATIPCEGTRLTRCLRGAKFDRVLVDAPCSNTGVLRRRADLRWRLQEAEIHRLAQLQEKLLTVAGQLTKPGGVLVYSTCSLEPEENERAVERFSATQAEFALQTTRSIFPPRDGVDGAYVVRFRKQ